VREKHSWFVKHSSCVMSSHNEIIISVHWRNSNEPVPSLYSSAIEKKREPRREKMLFSSLFPVWLFTRFTFPPHFSRVVFSPTVQLWSSLHLCSLVSQQPLSIEGKWWSRKDLKTCKERGKRLPRVWKEGRSSHKITRRRQVCVVCECCCSSNQFSWQLLWLWLD
jgi:hypothetical protein